MATRVQKTLSPSWTESSPGGEKRKFHESNFTTISPFIEYILYISILILHINTDTDTAHQY